MVFLWVYLFDSMRRYAIKYTEGDTKFSLFAVILMALPMTVRVVSNIVYKVGYSFTCSCIVFR